MRTARTSRGDLADIEAEGEVRFDREVRPEREVLEDNRKAASLGWHEDPPALRYGLVAEANGVAVGRDQTEDHAQHRTLAAAGRPDQYDGFARVDVQGQPGEHLLAPVAQPDVLERDRWAHAGLCAQILAMAAIAPSSAAVTAICVRASAATTASGPFASSVKIRTVSGSIPGG